MHDSDFDEFEDFMHRSWKTMPAEEVGRWFARFKAIDWPTFREILADFRAENRYPPKFGQIEQAIREAYPALALSLTPKRNAANGGTAKETYPEFRHAAHLRTHNPAWAALNDAAVLLTYCRGVLFRRAKSRSDQEYAKALSKRQCVGELTQAGYAYTAAVEAAEWIGLPRHQWEPFIADVAADGLPRETQTPDDRVPEELSHEEIGML